MSKKLISIDDIKNNPVLLEETGGKFMGLYKASLLLDKINQNTGIEIKIPKTKVISSKICNKIFSYNDFANNVKENSLPENLLIEIKQFIAACNGKVAVRSSANKEDGHGDDNRVFSGLYKTYLNTKIDNVENNIKKTIASLYTPKVFETIKDPECLEMSVILQEMVFPKISGVLYSNSFANENKDDEKIIIHYVKNSTADKMIINKENGFIKEFEKYSIADSDSHFVFNDINNIDSNDNIKKQVDAVKKFFKSDRDIYNKYFENLSFFMLTEISNNFEENLSTPIDMEFAITANEENGLPIINILQQRPYRNNENLKVSKVSSQTITGSYDNQDFIDGNVVVIEGDQKEFSPENLPDIEDKIVVLKHLTKEEFLQRNNDDEVLWDNYFLSTLQKHHDIIGNQKYKRAKALIDTTGFLLTALYGHYGNELKANNTNFVITNDPKYKTIKDGDNIELSLKNGKFANKSRMEFDAISYKRKLGGSSL